MKNMCRIFYNECYLIPNENLIKIDKTATYHLEVIDNELEREIRKKIITIDKNI
jgi:hypothetical protein